jgi:peptide/nickel transport system substrate-binding protein
MNEHDLRNLIAEVKAGRLSRRAFVHGMIALGLTAPIAGMMLSQSGVAIAETVIDYKPPKADGGGPLKLLLWQAPTLLNPHFAVGIKDQEACRLFYEPLAGWDQDGNLAPILAAEIPSKENDGLAEDGRSIVWKLKEGVKWHDGAPFTSDDVVFTWEYVRNPETAAVTIGSYKDIKVEKIDDHAVRVIFPQPTPFWADAFVGAGGMIIPRHLFGDYAGGKSRDAPTNLNPVGTGPYLFVDFKPGDTVHGKRSPGYHLENRPFFDTVEIKGGGDAVSAARAVLQTGEYDFAWNIQVEDEILQRMESGGQGKTAILPGGNVEFIALNPTDPAIEVDGERSSIKTKHPLFSDPAVREAINLLIDRASVQKFIYGRTGVATANFLNNPEHFRSKNTKFEFNVEKANQILEAAGWRRGADDIRSKDGKQLRFVFQTSINAPRQKNQAIIKQACQRAGIDVEVKSVAGSVFFASDVANPDTSTHFYCDAEMFTTVMLAPDPLRFMLQFVSWEVASKENKWQGRNISRWQNSEYDSLYRQAEYELDAVKRAAMYIKLNDIVIGDHYTLPEVARPAVAALKNGVTAHLSGWDNNLWQLANWYRET